MKSKRYFLLRAMGLTLAGGLVLSACDDPYVSGGAHVGIYYDSMMWNDYYRPKPPRPPGRPVHPIAPPPRPVHPIAPRPPVARPMPRR